MTNDRNRHERLRGYLNAANQNGEVYDAILEAAPGLSAMEAEQIIKRLAANIDTYRGRDRRGHEPFRRWAITWVRLVASLIVKVREMAPALMAAVEVEVPGLSPAVYAEAAERVTNHVTELLRDDAPASLTQWAVQLAIYEAEGLRAWPSMGSDLHKRCIYRGLWNVLQDCGDLGLGLPEESGWHPVIEELASEVWWWAFQNCAELAKSEVPIGARLKGKAIRRAQGWKTEKVRAKKNKPDDLNSYDIPVDWLSGEDAADLCRDFVAA